MRRFEIKEQEDHVLIVDTEYGIDLDIVLFGMFKSKAQQAEYAEALAQALNAAAIPTLEFSKYDEAGRLKTAPEQHSEDTLSAYARLAVRGLA